MLSPSSSSSSMSFYLFIFLFEISKVNRLGNQYIGLVCVFVQRSATMSINLTNWTYFFVGGQSLCACVWCLWLVGSLCLSDSKLTVCSMTGSVSVCSVCVHRDAHFFCYSVSKLIIWNISSHISIFAVVLRSASPSLPLSVARFVSLSFPKCRPNILSILIVILRFINIT